MNHAHLEIRLSDSRDCVNPPNEVKSQNHWKTSIIFFFSYLVAFDISTTSHDIIYKLSIYANKSYKRIRIILRVSGHTMIFLQCYLFRFRLRWQRAIIELKYLSIGLSYWFSIEWFLIFQEGSSRTVIRFEMIMTLPSQYNLGVSHNAFPINQITCILYNTWLTKNYHSLICQITNTQSSNTLHYIYLSWL